MGKYIGVGVGYNPIFDRFGGRKIESVTLMDDSTYRTYERPVSNASYDTFDCEIHKTEYGSVMIQTKDHLFEVYPNFIRTIAYAN